MNYEAVIGLEVHVQLKTASKMFTRVPAGYGAPPNTLTDPVVLALPGALPVLNKEALDKVIKAGLVLGCAIAPVCKWDRKNYFYPDSPKNYQITQYDQPICLGGAVEIELPGPARNVMGAHKKIPLTRIHLEEDVGKLTPRRLRLARRLQPRRHPADGDRLGSRDAHRRRGVCLSSPRCAPRWCYGRYLRLRHGEGPAPLRCQHLHPARVGETKARREGGAEEPQLDLVRARRHRARDQAASSPWSTRGGTHRAGDARLRRRRPALRSRPSARRRWRTTTATSPIPTSCR